MQKHPTKHMGLFRKVCASIVLGEILQDISTLQTGENHPLVIFIDDSNKVLLSADFNRLYSRII